MARNIEDYNPLTYSFEEPLTDDVRELKAIPMRLWFYQGKLELNLEVWLSAEDFNNSAVSLSKWNKSFLFSESDFPAIRAQFDSLFDGIEAAAFDFLGVAAEDYDLELYDINLHNLQLRAAATHKTLDKRIERKTRDGFEFNEIKNLYPDLVTGYYTFAWTYAKSNDQKLAKFN
jgi:hypothetical protein